MTLQERLRHLAAGLPSDAAAVTLTRADIVALLEEAGVPEGIQTAPRDLTVEDVAKQTGRAPSTVRGWLIAGDLRGYKLNGRDWRVPPRALREYLDGQRSENVPKKGKGQPVDISAWRRLTL